MQGFVVLVARANTIVMIPEKASAGCLHSPSLDSRGAVGQAITGDCARRACCDTAVSLTDYVV